MERWRRAEKFGFNPPSTIHDLVVAHSDDDKYTQWYQTFCWICSETALYVEL